MVVLVIFLKFWIGISGGHYTVCTGEGMVDMFDRIPGPRHWVVWIVLVAQLIGATFSIGALATVAGAFVNAIIPIGPTLSGWLVAFFALIVVWSGVYGVLQIVMSITTFIVVVGVIYVAVHVFPGLSEFLRGLTFQVPEVPEWRLPLRALIRTRGRSYCRLPAGGGRFCSPGLVHLLGHRGGLRRSRRQRLRQSSRRVDA